MLKTFLSALFGSLFDLARDYFARQKADAALEEKGRAEASAEVNAQTASKVDEMAQIASNGPSRSRSLGRLRDGTF